MAAAQVTAEEVQIWKAPEGMLAAEVGQQAEFVAEAAVEKNVRKVRCRPAVGSCRAQLPPWTPPALQLESAPSIRCYSAI